MPEDLTYRDTARLLAKLNGTDLVLVGGQAVNFWAEQYQEEDATLQAYAPFTSRDIDFFGDANLVKLCAQRLQCQYHLADPFSPTPNAGVLSFEDEDGIKHPIDFLRVLYGLDTEEVRRTSVPVDVLDEDGNVVAISLRVMNPVMCLESRVHNVVGLPRTYDTTHGRSQLMASIVCARVFLSRLLELGRTRDVLNGIKRIYELCFYDHDGRALFASKGIDPFDAVREDPRLPVKFNELQLPLMRQRLARRRSKPTNQGPEGP